MRFRFSKIVLLLILFSVLIFGLSSQIFASQKPGEDEKNLEEACQLNQIEESCQSAGPTECRKILEKCEQYYKEESERIAADISKTETEKKTLQNKIYTLTQKIKNLNYQITQSNLVIKDLKIQLGDTESSIEKTSSKIENSKEKLANILRTIYEEDQKPIIEILLAEDNLSGFFDNLVALECLNSKSNELLQDIKTLKTNLEQQKQSLDEEKDDLERMVKIQTLQKEESDRTKKDQEYYLGLTEKEYQKQLKEKEETEKKAAEIRARIFELIGVPKAPTFGEALDIAKYIEGATGIRPAFLLAVLTQESNIGKNVGQCYLPKKEEDNKKSRIMHPTRDVPYFLEITRELGRDPYNTLVSCPMEYGYGGAMGPAQFIPSTWILYRDKVKAITGKTADPWNIKDAFLAAALYLADCGATKKTYNAEWKAAMIYFSGTTNTKYRFYGDSVMSIAEKYQKDIEAIEAAK